MAHIKYLIVIMGIKCTHFFKFIYTGTALQIFENNVLVNTETIALSQLTDVENDSIDNVTLISKLTMS